MNVLNKAVKGLAVGVMVSLMGCTGLETYSNKIVNNTEKNGEIYGYAGISDATAKQFCLATKDKDPRCQDADNYVALMIFSKVGYADGPVGVTALVNKNYPNLNALKHNMVTGNSKAPYVKAKVVAGQFGELIEIVSTNGDGKCTWSGMPRVGGTVCKTYNYDYHKDFTGIVFK